MQHENAKYRNADTSVGRWPERANETGLDDMDGGGATATPTQHAART
jgi:hypothetical protein